MSETAERIAPPANDISVGDVFGRLESEMNALADLADQLQDMMGELISEISPVQKAPFLSRAQKLDLLVQSLRSLAAFLAILAQVAPSHWTLDPNKAAGAIKLSALARRLIEDAARNADDEGDLVLF